MLRRKNLTHLQRRFGLKDPSTKVHAPRQRDGAWGIPDGIFSFAKEGMLQLDGAYNVATMSKEHLIDAKALHAGEDGELELELSDDDVLDAMRRIPGYLDISTQDFRAIYHLAHGHALERLFDQISAGNLMQTGIEPLHPETRLDVAARALVEQKRKSLPVVDADGRVSGMLAEKDFLRRLQADSFLELLLRLVADQGVFAHRCHETSVSEAMTAPAVTIAADAGFRAIVNGFHAHEVRSMPVVGAEGRLQGLLLRKDFVRAFRLENLL